MDTDQPTPKTPNAAITVTRATGGWEVTETQGGTVIRSRRYSDWHRVERAVHVLELRASARSVNHQAVDLPPSA